MANRGLIVRTGVKTGVCGGSLNHNQKVVHRLRVSTRIKAGSLGGTTNHNQKLVRTR